MLDSNNQRLSRLLCVCTDHYVWGTLLTRKVFRPFLMRLQVKNIWGDQFSSFLTFKQSRKWISPQRQVVEVSCDRP